MFNIIKYFSLIAIFSFLLVNDTYAADIYKVNVEQSKIQWTGRKLVGDHTGTIDIKSGEIKFENGRMMEGTIIVDMNSIKDLDLKDTDLNKKLVDHLKSPDFFDVKKFPEAKFVFYNPMRKLNDDYFVEGRLFIKDRSNLMKMAINLTVKGNIMSGTTYCSFDRSKFDVRYGSKSFFADIADKVIYDDIDLKIDIVAEK